MLALLLIGAGCAEPLRAQQLSGFTNIYVFQGGADGGQPTGLSADSSGNLYGIATYGGTGTHNATTACSRANTGCGVVFELVKSAGVYTERVLYSFTGVNGDGAYPDGNLVIDSAGNLYGTTIAGGTSANCPQGCGTVFELVKSGGSYAEKILYSLPEAETADQNPDNGLAMDGAGNLFGTTNSSVYELIASSGSYTPKTLATLTDGNSNPLYPRDLALDSAGNLYGYVGPTVNPTSDTVIEWDKASGYGQKTLFTSAEPLGGGLRVDVAGNLYGSAAQKSAGSLFFTLVNSPGGYVERDLYSAQSAALGFQMDAAGDIYALLQNASIIELVDQSGNYTERTLASSLPEVDGYSLVVDSSGDLYGTGLGSASLGNGAVFEQGAAAGSALAVYLENAGASLQVNFGDVTQGANDQASFVVVNAAASPVSVRPLSIAGTNAAEFAIESDGCSNQVLAAGASCAVKVAFTPAAIGGASATLTIDAPFANGVPGASEAISLSGGGVSGATVAFAPGAASIPAVPLGATQTQAVTLSNTGTAPLVISSIVASAGDFSESNDCPKTLAVGASCGITAAFTPGFAGPEAGAITVTDDAAGSPQTLTVSSAGSIGSTVPRMNWLHFFQLSPSEGYGLAGRLLVDGSGDVFGTTVLGGTYAVGTAFELTNQAGSYTESILHSFGDNIVALDGAEPSSGLIQDSAGDLYGTTSSVEPAGGCGSVYELVNDSGTYIEKILYRFACATDGDGPVGSLVMDTSGDLFGATVQGGNIQPSNCAAVEIGTNSRGCGTVYELVNSGGSYAEKVLYRFTGQHGDGMNPQGGLAMNAAGDIFGTTSGGGSAPSAAASTQCSAGCGIVFELSPAASGGYTETVLYSPNGANGGMPVGDVMLDAGGNLFGITRAGGANGAGTVYMLAYSSGTYTSRVIYNFGVDSTDGSQPAGGVSLDSSGNLFGVTAAGGQSGGGTLYELVNSAGSYSESVLFGFNGASNGPVGPNSTPVLDAAGNLYGTASQGTLGAHDTVFQYTRQAPSALGITTTSSALSVSAAGGTATASLQVDALAGFAGTVDLTCSVTFKGSGSATDLPACSLTPSQVQVSPGKPASVTLAVTTAAATASAAGGRARDALGFGGSAVAAALALLVVPRRRRLDSALRAAGCCLIAAWIVSGCGGGGGSASPPAGSGSLGSGGASGASSSSSSNASSSTNSSSSASSSMSSSSGTSSSSGAPTSSGTTGGSYTVTVTATSGSYASSMTMSLAVQ